MYGKSMRKFLSKTDRIIKFVLDRWDRFCYLVSRVPYRINKYIDKRESETIYEDVKN